MIVDHVFREMDVACLKRRHKCRNGIAKVAIMSSDMFLKQTENLRTKLGRVENQQQHTDICQLKKNEINSLECKNSL